MLSAQQRADKLARQLLAILDEDDEHTCCASYGVLCPYHALRSEVKAVIDKRTVTRHELSASESNASSATSTSTAASTPAVPRRAPTTPPTVPTTRTTILQTPPKTLYTSNGTVLPPTPEPDVPFHGYSPEQPPPSPQQQKRVSTFMSTFSFRAPSIKTPSIRAPSLHSTSTSNSLGAFEVEGSYPPAVQKYFQLHEQPFKKTDGVLTMLSPNCFWLAFFRKEQIRVYERLDAEDSFSGETTYALLSKPSKDISLPKSGTVLLTPHLAIFTSQFKILHLSTGKDITPSGSLRVRDVKALSTSPSGRYIAVASIVSSTMSRIYVILYDDDTKLFRMATRTLEVRHEVTALHISDSDGLELFVGCNIAATSTSSGRSQRSGKLQLYSLSTPLGATGTATAPSLLPEYVLRTEAALGTYGTTDDWGITTISRPSTPANSDSNYVAVCTWTQSCPPQLFRINETISTVSAIPSRGRNTVYASSQPSTTTTTTYTLQPLRLPLRPLATTNSNNANRLQTISLSPDGSKLLLVSMSGDILLLKTSLLPGSSGASIMGDDVGAAGRVRLRKLVDVGRAKSPKEGSAVGWRGSDEVVWAERGGKWGWVLVGS